MNRIKSKNYKMGTYETNKNSLSRFDEKIYVLDENGKTCKILFVFNK